MKSETETIKESETNNSKTHKLRPQDVFNLAAPHTWAASVMPAILALVVSYRETGWILPDLTICLFLIAILMQSAGAIRTEGDRILLTEKGRYLLLVMMRQFFIGVNHVRDQARNEKGKGV